MLYYFCVIRLDYRVLCWDLIVELYFVVGYDILFGEENGGFDMYFRLCIV